MSHSRAMVVAIDVPDVVRHHPQHGRCNTSCRRVPQHPQREKRHSWDAGLNQGAPEGLQLPVAVLVPQQQRHNHPICPAAALQADGLGDAIAKPHASASAVPAHVRDPARAAVACPPPQRGIGETDSPYRLLTPEGCVREDAECVRAVLRHHEAVNVGARAPASRRAPPAGQCGWAVPLEVEVVVDAQDNGPLVNAPIVVTWPAQGGVWQNECNSRRSNQR